MVNSHTETLNVMAQAMQNYATSSGDVIGFYISGSFGKDMIHEHSDLDPVFIVQEGAKEKVEEYLVNNFDTTLFDLYVLTLSEYEKLSTEGTSGMGSDRYDYAHIKVAIDKTDRNLQAIVDSRGSLSGEEKDYLGTGYLDGYIDAFYRSLKAARENWLFAQRLESAKSISLMLSFLFTAENRIVPFAKYMEPELQNHPLDIPVSPKELIIDIEKIFRTAEVSTQIKLFQMTCDYARQKGFGHVVDDWEGKPEQLVKVMKLT